MKITLFNDGEQQVPTRIFFKDDGEWCNAQKIYVKENGSWKQTFEYLTKEFLLFLGDEHTTDASPTNPGYFFNANLAMDIDSEGNYILGSNRYQSSSVGYLTYLTKINKEGEQIWETQLTENRAGPATGTKTYLRGITVDDSDNIYVTGYMNHTTGNIGFLMKLNSSGVDLWQKTWAYPSAATNYPNEGYIARLNDSGDPVVFGMYNYFRGYNPLVYGSGSLAHGICYTFSASDGQQTNNRMYVGSPGGLGTYYIYRAVRVGDHFYFNAVASYTGSPNAGTRPYTSLVKTNMACDTMVADIHTFTNTQNIDRISGLYTNGTYLAVAMRRDSTGGRYFVIYDTDLGQEYTWQWSDSTSGAVAHDPVYNWCYEGDFIYAAVTATDERVNFFKLNVTTGAIVWQNKLVGDSDNKVVKATDFQTYLRKDPDGYLVFYASTNKSDLYNDAHVNYVLRVPEDGSGTGTYNKFTYSTSTEISISAGVYLTGYNPYAYASSAQPTDYGDPDITQADPDIPILRINRTS